MKKFYLLNGCLGNMLAVKDFIGKCFFKVEIQKYLPKIMTIGGERGD